MELAHRWSDRNLTKIELVIAIFILTILIGTLSRNVLVLFSRAEQSMIASTVININTALNYGAAMAVMRGKYQELDTIAESNPMLGMQSNIDVNTLKIKMNDIPSALVMGSNNRPSNYGGEINAYTMDSMEKGKWYFNQDNLFLTYIVSNSEYFTSDNDNASMIQFRIKIDYADKNSNKQYDPEIDEFKSMKLHPVDNYQWNY